MELFEYQSQMILKKFGMKVAPFGIATDPHQAVSIAKALDLKHAVIKLQSKTDAIQERVEAEQMLHSAQRIFAQDPHDRSTVLIEPDLPGQAYYYLAIMIDPIKVGPCVIASTLSWKELRSLDNPRKSVIIEPIKEKRLTKKSRNRIFSFLNLPVDNYKTLRSIIDQLVEAFFTLDCRYVQIDSSIIDGQLYTVGSQLKIDEHFLYRQQEIAALDTSWTAELARKHNIGYQSFFGTVGYIGTGKALLLSVIDEMGHRAPPSHFLDIAHLPCRQGIHYGLEIALKHPGLSSVVLAIVGYQYSCLEYLEAYLQEIEHLDVDLAVSVFFEGKGSKEAIALAQQKGLRILGGAV